MNILSFLLYYLLIFPLSLLPMRVLYGVADFIFLIIYYVIPYRKKVVMKNLTASFPDKPEIELKKIARKFYRHFCSVMVESIKSFTISNKQLLSRFKIVNPEILTKYYDKKKSVILATGHYANWEWAALSLALQSKYQAAGIYQPISNAFFDKIMQNTRSKNGLILIPPKEVNAYFELLKNRLVAYGFVADQSPSNPDKGYWMQFLNQPTSVFVGSEKYAKLFDCVVLYGRITMPKRGHYELEYHLVSDDAVNTEVGYITKKFTLMLEQLIKSRPELWLWTHRRWKHKPKSTDVIAA